MFNLDFQAHEILALEVLTLLLATPSDDSVEVSVGFLKECGQKLTEVSPRGVIGKVYTLISIYKMELWYAKHIQSGPRYNQHGHNVKSMI